MRRAKEERKEREEGMLSQDQKDCPIPGVEWKRETERGRESIAFEASRGEDLCCTGNAK